MYHWGGFVVGLAVLRWSLRGSKLHRGNPPPVGLKLTLFERSADVLFSQERDRALPFHLADAASHGEQEYLIPINRLKARCGYGRRYGFSSELHVITLARGQARHSTVSGTQDSLLGGAPTRRPTQSTSKTPPFPRRRR